MYELYTSSCKILSNEYNGKTFRFVLIMMHQKSSVKTLTLKIMPHAYCQRVFFHFTNLVKEKYTQKLQTRHMKATNIVHLSLMMLY